MYSIARACSREQIDQCSCDNTERTPPEDGDFQWGGCGDNLEHGYNYARKFAAQASTSDASRLLNDHNSEAGRLVSAMNMYSLATEYFQFKRVSNSCFCFNGDGFNPNVNITPICIYNKQLL